ncbi:unnamed protein product [Rotaria socialis]|uniref:Uncharacterized protein n=2 Tax=Rotaria socialis TaxID=392032 RepID=A0A820JIX4_9BILA|nr:unnamed protein product [Rotaria socialis]CAF3617210.1 unnamed protein product [Rotaria socialis]CAF3668864.1 unnamed protein product [Rotaria socialis]CAF4195841.1 unnamed protein product [Rotaria socialis]CAF4325507.1 unnamed protein product [Rotaria socialis]
MVLEQESFFNDYVSFTKQCVIERKDVEQFYEKAFEKTQLGVPHNHINGRLQYPSHLCGLTIEILGIGEEEAAGDIALSSAALYSNEICLNQFTNNEKILYIYIQLKHRVITLNPVTKSLSSQTAHKAQEKKIPIDFPSIWVIFSCVLKVASFEIRWRSPTRCFNIAYANIYLEPTQANQFQWQADTKKIEIFKTLAKPAEIKRLNKSIKLIPKDARTPHSATSPAVDLVAFREQDESHREQKQELKRKYDVTEETNNEDVACSSTDDSSKQQKLKYYNELKKVEDDDKKDEADYDSEDDVSEDENDDYDDANYDENYYDNNFDNDEPLDD